MVVLQPSLTESCRLLTTLVACHLILSNFFHIPPELRSPKLGTVFQVQPHYSWVDGSNNLSSVAMFLPTQLSLQFPLCIERTHYRLVFSLQSTVIPLQLPFQQGRCLASQFQYMALLLHGCKTLHFSLLNFIRYLLAHFSNQWRSLWIETLPFIMSAILYFCITWQFAHDALCVTVQATDRDIQQYQSLVQFTDYQQPPRHQGHWSLNFWVQWFSQFST